MIDSYALGAEPRRQPADGPLGPFVDRCLAWLESHAYTTTSIRRRLRLVGLFNEWAMSRGLDVGDLGDAAVVEFVQARRRKGKTLRLEVHALRKLMELLREQGCFLAPALPAKQDSPHAVLQDFESFLLEERGVKAATADQYVWFIARFLAQHPGTSACWYKDVELSDLTAFLLCVAESAPGQTAHAATALRAFFRFLVARRMLVRNPADGIPRVTTWRLKALPDRLARPEFDRLLEAQERVTPAGKRNYALLLILARLGLRASEVCDLTLEDVASACAV
jgi:site-specific recombinase XerD